MLQYDCSHFSHMQLRKRYSDRCQHVFGYQGLSTLSNLAGLRRLQLWSVQLPIAAMSGIAACTSLKDLDLDIREDWTPVDKAFSGMMQVTQMTGLMCLRICATVNGKNFRLNLVRGLGMHNH